ncbi:MAG: lysophospholipid acyltransferase family protein [Gammaproteobacteria bacterium]|nr:lysophospholipid acyltransferase family protein [Gammaproteobacteria bacterium]MDH5659556.1 lysophospholipid acyltransferase family protein [Gammaproteobacteria bacterium]
MFKKFILKNLVWYVYRTLYATWRVQIIEPPELSELKKNNKTFILAHWHGDELAVLFLVKHFGLATMTSTSKDGELINHVILKFGGKTSRGSSTRGGVSALKGLIKLCKNGTPTSVAVDGPQGPIYIAKPGVFEISRLTGAPIFSIGACVKKKTVSKQSWNNAYIPKPFAKVIVTFMPYKTITKDMNPKDELYANELAKVITDTNKYACDIF